jgi:three-Cys-motif partner protein
MTRRDHFERFEDHTLLKHFLLDAYLKAWGTILLRARFQRIWFVDAFAGAGRDQTGQPGSPLIAAQIARDLNAKHFPQGIDSKRGMHILAIEWDPELFRLLKENLAQFANGKAACAHVRPGTLEDFIDRFLEHVGSDPVLFFLDPFGVDGLSAALIGRLLANDRNEALVLFHDEGAVRLHGKASTEVPDEDELLDKKLDERAFAHESLFGPEDTLRQREEAMAAAREAVARSLAGHKSNPQAKAILDKAYGGDWWHRELDGMAPALRQTRARQLYQDRVLRFRGASYVLPFSIDTERGRHKYYLLHASQHPRAFAAMKDAMHRARSKQGTQVELTTNTDVEVVANAVAAHFAGQTVRWSGDGSVQEYALAHTALWMHERGALKGELVRRRLERKMGRALAFSFQ